MSRETTPRTGAAASGGASPQSPASPSPAAAARVVLDRAGIDRAATRIAHEITERGGDPAQLALIAIADGGVPVAELLREGLRETAKTEVPLGILDVTLYRDDVIASGRRPIPRRTRIPFSVTARSVVLVEDVVFTGRTVRAAMDAVIDFGRPASIRVATLVDRGHRELPIRVDFVGKNIPTARSQQVVLRCNAAGELEVVVQ
jgi:pyrimidine operon attenuation protein/uracil phosphoribosyltransferase